MKAIEDAKFFVKYAKENPKETFNLIAQATALVSLSMLGGILIIKGATTMVEELKNLK